MYQEYKKPSQGDSKEAKVEYFYFNGRGRGEGIRCLLEAGGIPYVDHRLELGGEEWPKIKPTTPYGHLPILKVGDVTLAESAAIGLYVAKKGGLAGSNPEDECRILSLALVSNDFREGLARVMFLKAGEEEKAKQMKEFLEGCASGIMDNLTKAIGDQPFFVGGKLSYADIWFYHCVELMVLGAKITDFLPKWPKLETLYNNVEKSPKIAKYLANRPETAF